MDEEKVKDIIQSALNCEPDEFYGKYRAYKQAEEEFMKLYEPFKEKLIALHKNYNDLPNTAIIGGAKVTYVAPSIRNTINTAKLKEEEPELAKKYVKSTPVKASVRIDKV